MSNTRMKYLGWMMLLVGTVTMVSTACDEETPDPDGGSSLTYDERIKRDTDSLRPWLEDRMDSLRTLHNDQNLTYTEDSSGLFWLIYEEGTGPLAEDGDIAFTYYRGTFMTGEVFDENLNSLPFSFNIGTTGVIEGWNEGILKFREGSKGYLFIPSPLAYGTRARGEIPANSILIFNMELVELR